MFNFPKVASDGGACTSAFLEIVYRQNEISWVDCIREMRQILKSLGFPQTPQLTSSHIINVKEKLTIIPHGFKPGINRKLAVLIGINYIGQDVELNGSHNDIYNMQEYLKTKQGFNQSDISLLLDDGKSIQPTLENIVNILASTVKIATDGDAIFVHYSGHGARMMNEQGDNYIDTLVPVDYETAGQLTDSDISELLSKHLNNGVTLTALIDSCHSGSIMELPYRFSADDKSMVLNQRSGRLTIQKKLTELLRSITPKRKRKFS